jgi:four helix bundle suffix protein
VRSRYKSDSSEESTLSDIRTTTPEVAPNTLLSLINQASYLLDRQLKRLEQDFLKNDGFTERLYAARNRKRNLRSDPSDSSDLDAPLCPRCGKPMRQRIARKGPNVGGVSAAASPIPIARARAPCPPRPTSRTLSLFERITEALDLRSEPRAYEFAKFIIVIFGIMLVAGAIVLR